MMYYPSQISIGAAWGIIERGFKASWARIRPGANILPFAGLVRRARSRARNACDRAELLVGQPKHKAAAADFQGALQRRSGPVLDQPIAARGSLNDAGVLPELRRLGRGCQRSVKKRQCHPPK